MLRTPVAHDESLETKLVLEDVVLEVGVLASVAVVDLVVRAHDGTGASTHGIGERPNVELVLGIVSMCSRIVPAVGPQTRVTSSRLDEMAALTLAPPWR
jgi:hypothetical protein